MFSVLLSIITLLILLATGMHVIYGHKHDLKMDDPLPPSTSEPLLSRTTTISGALTTNQVDERDQSTSSDEITPLIARSEGRVDSGEIHSSSLTHLIILSSSRSKPHQLLFINKQFSNLKIQQLSQTIGMSQWYSRSFTLLDSSWSYNHVCSLLFR